MKAKFKLSDLRDGLARLGQAPGANAAHPGHAAIRIKADIEGVIFYRVTGTCQVRVMIEAEVEDDGEVIISHDQLNSFASRVKGEAIILDCTGAWLTLEAGKSRAKLQTIEEKELPKEAEFDGDCEFFDLPVEDFIHGVRAVTPCIGLKEPDSLVNLNMRTVDGVLWLTATDRKKFAQVYFPEVLAEIDLLIPGETAAAMGRMFNELEGALSLSIYPQGLFMVHDKCVAQFAIGEGRYPDIVQAVNYHKNKEVIASGLTPREELSDALRTASLYMDPEEPFIAIEFKKERLFLSGSNSTALASREIEAKTAPGDTMLVNPDYLASVMNVFSGQNVLLQNTGEAVMASDPDNPNRFGFVALKIKPLKK